MLLIIQLLQYCFEHQALHKQQALDWDYGTFHDHFVSVMQDITPFVSDIVMTTHKKLDNRMKQSKKE